MNCSPGFSPYRCHGDWACKLNLTWHLRLQMCLAYYISHPLEGSQGLFRRVCVCRSRTRARQAIGTIVAVAVFVCAQTPALAIEAANVLVLYNQDSPDGVQIANYYAQVHPEVQLLGLSGVSTAEQVTQDEYLNVIRPQVLSGLLDSTEVIVTTKGLPLRIENTAANPGTYPGWRGDLFGVAIQNDWWEPYSSLESELTRIDLIDSADAMADQAYFLSPPTFPFATNHQASNPYFNQRQAFDRSNPANEGIRLTSRLDGFTVTDVISSIDRAQRAVTLPNGQLVIVDDDPDAPAALADLMPQLAQDVLIPQGQASVFDQTNANIIDAPLPVIGLVSHGSHAAGTGYINNLQFTLANGALLHTWESFNAYSFVQGNNQFGQGLVGEWLAKGGTAALGHVQEPTASAVTVANEDILFDMLLNGFTLAEAAWAATPQLSFVNTVIGDPLMTLSPWLMGDINLDGVVGVVDLTVVLTHWNQPAIGTANGDLNFDGWIDVLDLNLVLANWNNITPASVAVPEPASAGIAFLGAAALLLRPRNRPV